MKTAYSFDFPLRWTARGLVTGLLLVSGVVAADDDDAQELPATGQTTCYDSAGNRIGCAGTGQDGEIRAGATLRYKDQNNGTIRDRNTGLTWEKKSDDGSIHDKDNIYKWDDGFAVHVARLNSICAKNESVTCATNIDCVAAGVGGKCGFAGKRDWRVPNFKELQSIINYENSDPAVSAAFNSRCVAGATVLTGSCTGRAPSSPQGSDHWSSTTLASDPMRAWGVGFDDGSGPDDLKTDKFYVRAVRGGHPTRTNFPLQEFEVEP